jgi:hypothetical protein
MQQLKEYLSRLPEAYKFRFKNKITVFAFRPYGSDFHQWKYTIVKRNGKLKFTKSCVLPGVFSPVRVDSSSANVDSETAILMQAIRTGNVVPVAHV